MAQDLAQGHLDKAHSAGRVAGEFQDRGGIGTSTSEDIGPGRSFPGERQSGSGFALRLRIERRTDWTKSFLAPSLRQDHTLPVNFCSGPIVHRIHICYLEVLCGSAIGFASEFHVFTTKNRKLSLCSREHKDLDSCSYYQMPLPAPHGWTLSQRRP